MFQNYLITALRSFSRSKLYSFINIAGLTVGLTCAIFIILLVRDELSYDKWIPGAASLYRLEFTVYPPGQPPIVTSRSPFPAPEAMLAGIPEVKAIAHLEPRQMTVTIGDRQFPEQVDVVNPDFFQVIRLPLDQGNPANVFAQPESVVITERAAAKYFGGALAIGRTIVIGGADSDNHPSNQRSLVVTGIMRDLPHNTQLSGDVFIPNTSAADPMTQNRKQQWLDESGWGYVQLAPNADPKLVLAKLNVLIDRAVDPMKLGGIHMRGSQIEVPNLTPFRDDHLSTDRNGSLTPAGSWTTVYGFSAIAVLILLVACFNFTNLATARATLRAREISLRKVMGADRGQLIVQFLGESVLTALICLILALSLVEILLPGYDRLLNNPIQFHYFGDWRLLLALIGIAIAAGLIGGAYPALILSNFRPAAVLRTNGGKQSGSGLVRTSLVVLQFAVSIGLGIAAVVVFEQISFARAVELGFNKDGVVIVDGGGLSTSARESFVRALRTNPNIEGAANSDDVPFGDNRTNIPIQSPGAPAAQVVRDVSISPGFLRLYGIRLLSGRDFSDARGQDQATNDGTGFNVLINEAAATHFGYSVEGAVGKHFATLPMPERFTHATTLTIIGVAADFKIDGATAPIAPAIYLYEPPESSFVSIRVRANDLAGTLSFIDRTWRSFAPSIAIQRHFLNGDFERQFLADEKQDAIFGLFVGISIFIACLGLFGLAAFTAERRTKEIGLRKVFGAKSRDIVWLLLWQFSIPVLVANLIAWPIAYYYLRDWLDGYTYRISLSPLYFLAVGAGALAIAWVTVIVHAANVARGNPVHALRYE